MAEMHRYVNDFSGIIHEGEEQEIEEGSVEGSRSEDEVSEAEPDRQPERPSPSPEDSPSVQTVARDSTDSSTPSTEGRASLEDYQMPQINYARDVPGQHLVAVIGREFDEPCVVSRQLQRLSPRDRDDAYVIKFVPYSVKRSTLTKYDTDWSHVSHYDVICMCYNASEARLLLTGRDGFYTRLLKHVERLLGPNRACFVVTRYVPPVVATGDRLVSPRLKRVLSSQSSLERYLEGDRVLSWTREPSDFHVTRLVEMARSDSNPDNICVTL